MTSAALFWFDWQEISDAGHATYGAYAYRQLLPLIARYGELETGTICMFFDGDCIAEGGLEIPCQGFEEQLCLSAVERRGTDRCYVVAAYSSGALDLNKLHQPLGRAKAIGYLGKTSCTGMKIDDFVQLTGSMSLEFSLRLSGSKLNKVSFAFVGDQQLREWGFDPVASPDAGT